MNNVIKEVKGINKKYSCFITVVDKPNGGKGKLAGIPIAVKDNISTAGIQTTAGSRILEGYIPPFDATAVAKIKSAGGNIIGKCSMDEFGFGTFSVNTGFSIPKNPHNPERSCGGSSGGVAAFVAAFKSRVLGLGTSTGGSISCPASFCGVVGLTPTYGLVSRYGLIDYSNSMDKIGCITKTVKDAALLLSIIAGNDYKDSTSALVFEPEYTTFCGKSIKGLKIGVPKEYFEGVDSEIKKVVEAAIEKLEKLGAKIIEISLPMTEYALAAYYIIATAEASTNLAKYCGMRYGLHKPLEGAFNEYFSKVRAEGFCEESKRRIMLGTFARMAGYRDAYYLKAMKVRTKVIEEFKKAFKSVDVIAAPTMPIVAPKFAEIKKMSPVQQYAMDVLTVPANLAGLPHLSVPCSPFIVDEKSKSAGGKNMPVGLHLIADHFEESKLIQVGDAFEQSLKVLKRAERGEDTYERA